jgi:hypothetical protein
MFLTAAASRGARRGSSAALRWVQPRREPEVQRGVHATAAAANSAAPPPPSNNGAHQHQQTRPAAAQAGQPPRAAQTGTPTRHTQNNAGAGWQGQAQGQGQNQGAPARSSQQQQRPPPQQFSNGGYGAGAVTQRSATTLPEDVDALYHQMQHLGSRWADLHAEAELLEESKKCVLASITLHFMNEGDNKSSGEAKAFAAPEYVEHVRKMVEARRKANQAKVEFEGIKTHMNLTRTYEASRRAEMTML